MSDPREDPEVRLHETSAEPAVLVRLTLADLDEIIGCSGSPDDRMLTAVLEERLEKARELLLYAEARARFKR